MKKTLLALAVAAMSANAFAVDLNATTSNAVNYASEIKLPSVLTDTTANDLDVTVQLGFSATANVKRYVRFDLTNAQFEAPVVASDLTTTVIKTPAGVDEEGQPTPEVAVGLSPSVAVGGTKGSSYVVVEITPDTTLANTAALRFALDTINATGGDASIQYRLYETGVDAAAGNANVLAARSGKLFGFQSGLKAAIDYKGAEQLIDVTQESKYFVNDESLEDISNLISKLSFGAVEKVYDKLGQQVEVETLIKGAKLEVAGDFSAGAKEEGVLSKSAVTLAGDSATEISATSAVFNVMDLNKANLILTVDGESALATQSFTAKLVSEANDNYTVASVDLGVVGELQKNGSSLPINLALKPGGAYANFLRISNTSNLEGKFFITVISDEGKSATVALSDVAGQPATLAPRASTTQMTIQQVFDAAAAKGLALSGEGKLRLVVEGEVPNLDAQTYTVSKDGNSFATF